MTILASDVVFLKSRVMDDVPEGGGGPTGAVVPFGASNAIFTDVTTVDRAGGDVSIRQLFTHVRTADADKALDMHLVMTRLPSDDAVSVTMVECEPFATRSEIARAVASYLTAASEWGGYLLEDHIKDQHNITLLQRPGTTLPVVGHTYVLVYDEGLATERRQAVRVLRVSSETRVFTDVTVSPPKDFQGELVTLELEAPLAFAFPGSPPSIAFSRQANKSKLRDTMATGAVKFYGATRLAQATQLGDDTVRVESIFTRIVPSGKDPRSVLAERPGAQRQLTLASAPRLVQVGVTPHTRRIKINQSNVSTSYVLPVMQPLPEPGTVVVSYRSLGQRYTLTDDGAGHFTGAGSGALMYALGSGNVTLDALPDIGSTLTIHYGTRVAYTDRGGQGAAIRPPEYAFLLEFPGAIPGSITITYTSANVVRTMSDDGVGGFSGAGTGTVDYPSGSVLVHPQFMPDAGAQLQVSYQTDPLETELLAGPAPDAAGMVALTLAQHPVAGSLELCWVTARQVGNTSGGSLSQTEAVKSADVSYTQRLVPDTHAPAPASMLPASAAPVRWQRPEAYNASLG